MPVEDHVRALLALIDSDPDREGLRDTPRRVVEALVEMTAGERGPQPSEILSTTFEAAGSQMVVLSGVPFTSLCEHHLLPFHGVAKIGYIPVERVVGISKLARLLDCYAARLQIQERLTSQVAEAIQEHLSPLGVGVTLTATHLCMSCRGVQKTCSLTTSVMLGALRDKPEARQEFLSL